MPKPVMLYKRLVRRHDFGAAAGFCGAFASAKINPFTAQYGFAAGWFCHAMVGIATFVGAYVFMQAALAVNNFIGRRYDSVFDTSYTRPDAVYLSARRDWNYRTAGSWLGLAFAAAGFVFGGYGGYSFASQEIASLTPPAPRVQSVQEKPAWPSREGLLSSLSLAAPHEP